MKRVRGGGSYIFCPGPSAGAAAAEELVTVFSSSVFHPFSVQGISSRGFAVQMSKACRAEWQTTGRPVCFRTSTGGSQLNMATTSFLQTR